MKTRLTIVAILLVFLTIPMMSAPKPKYKSLWLSGCANYEGYIVKNTPEGEGKLTIYNHQDIKIKDVITGKFSNNIVTDATLAFAGGLEYKGDIELNIRPDGIDYILSNGYIQVYKQSVDTIRIQLHSETVSRKYDGFDTNGGFWQTSITTTELSNTAKEFIKYFEPILEGENYSACYGVSIELKKSRCSIRKNNTQYSINIDDCKSIQCMNNGRRSVFQFNDGSNVINVGYELETIESVESEGNDEHLVYFDNSYDYYIQRSFENGKIIVSSKLGESWRKHCSQENKEKVESILHYPKWEADVYDLYETTYCVKIEYADGSSYNGFLFTKQKPSYGDSGIPNQIPTILSYKEAPQKDLYSNGVLDLANGEQFVFVSGYELDDVIDYGENLEKEILAEIQAKEQAKKNKELQEKQQLSNKYGKNYVDALFDSNGDKMLVGTPFELLEKYEHCSLNLDVDGGDSKGYYWYWEDAYVRIKKGYIWVRNGKVTSIVYF